MSTIGVQLWAPPGQSMIVDWAPLICATSRTTSSGYEAVSTEGVAPEQVVCHVTSLISGPRPFT
ncbi:MAG: hypothetical protein ACR2GH_01675 [Pseudonocardia sp.]